MINALKEKLSTKQGEILLIIFILLVIVSLRAPFWVTPLHRFGYISQAILHGWKTIR